MDTHAERCGKLLEQLEEKTLDDPELLKLPVAVSARRYIHAVKTLKKSKDDNVFTYSFEHLDKLDDQYANLEDYMNKIGTDANMVLVQENLDALYGEIREGIVASNGADEAHKIFSKKFKIPDRDKKVAQPLETGETKRIRSAMLWEAMVFWVSSFGEKASAPFDDWWPAFVDHLTIYGYNKVQLEDGTIQNAFCNVIGDGEVTPLGLREYLLRFGPFDQLLLRTSHLTDFGTQKLVDWFLPTSDEKKVKQLQKANPKLAFILRYGTTSGTFTYHRKKKFKTHCVPQGYICAQGDKLDLKDCENTVGMIVKYLVKGDPFTSVKENIKAWKEHLRSIYDDPSTTDNYVSLGADEFENVNENKTQYELHKEAMAKMDNIQDDIKDFRSEFQQVSLRLLTALPSSMPRQFILVPKADESGGDVKKGLSSFLGKCKRKVKDTFMTTWVVHVLCEGNLCTAPDGQRDSKLIGAHFTNHPGYEITLPKDTLMKALPYIRVGLGIASVAASAAAGGLVNLGPLCDILDSFDVAGSFDAVSERLAEAECALTDAAEATKMPDSQERIMDDYRQLRAILGDKIPKDDLETGEFGGLTMMMSPMTGDNKDKDPWVWVCEDPNCRKGLVARNSNKADPLAQVSPAPETPVEDNTPEDEQKAPSAPAAQPSPVVPVQGVVDARPPNYEKATSNSSSAAPNDVGAGFPPSPGGGGGNQLASASLSLPSTARQTTSRRGGKGLLKVEVLGARDLFNADAGMFRRFMKKNDLSDPYVEISVKDCSDVFLKTKETKVVNDCLDPDWNQEFSWVIRRDIDEITFTVYDHEKRGDPKFLGQHSVAITDDLFEFNSETDGNLDLTPAVGTDKKYKNKIKGHLMVNIHYEAPLEQ